MELLKDYAVCVAAAAVIAGIITGLLHKKDLSTVLLRMIAGLFLAFTIIHPVLSMEITDIGLYIGTFSESGVDAAHRGEKLAEDAWRQYIKSQTEAYILDKAREYGARLDVEVTLDDGDIPVPASIRIDGSVSPYAKTCLRELMARDLGVLEENQIWIG